MAVLPSLESFEKKAHGPQLVPFPTPMDSAQPAKAAAEF
jgi:hypothetical protein